MTKKRQNYMRRADTAFAKAIRSIGYCQSDRESHAGNLQCAHIIPRTYKTIRTHPDNALCLCQGCHTFYTHRPLEWEAWVKIKYPGRWEHLRSLALTYEKVDWKSECERWESEVQDLLGTA